MTWFTWDNIYVWSGRLYIAAVAAGGLASVLLYISSNIVTAQKDRALAEFQAKAALELQQARNAATQIDINLLEEQRLTSTERWRLRHLEKAVLPRSQFVDWPALTNELKAGHFSPINLAVISRPEPLEFGFKMMQAMQAAGVLRQFIRLPSDLGDAIGASSTGAIMLFAADDGDRLNQTLWRKFEIGGVGMSITIARGPLATLPKETSCLVIIDNGAAFAPMSGQDGEGIDSADRPKAAAVTDFPTHVIAVRGQICGVTDSTGINGHAIIFKLAPPGSGSQAWTVTRLATLATNMNGPQPTGGLIRGPNGTLYGAVGSAAGATYGYIFAVTP